MASLQTWISHKGLDRFKDLGEALSKCGIRTPALLAGALRNESYAASLLDDIQVSADRLDDLLCLWRASLPCKPLESRRILACRGYLDQRADSRIGPYTPAPVLQVPSVALAPKLSHIPSRSRAACPSPAHTSDSLATWRKRAIACVQRMGVAAVAVSALGDLSCPMICGGALFGSRRATTLQKRVRCWEDFEFWCRSSGYALSALTTAILIRYLHERVAEPCAPTVPLSISCSFRMLMKSADYKPAPNWTVISNAVKDIQRSLSNPLVLPSKAPAFSLNEVQAIIAVFWSSKQRLIRIMAGFVIMCIMAALRWDDGRHIAFSSLGIVENRLEGMAVQSKTTGPGKKQLHFKFYAKATDFTGQQWAAEFLRLLGTLSDTLPDQRHWILPRPSPNLDTYYNEPCEYSVALPWFRRICLEAQIPLERVARLRLHSMRATLDECSFQLGIPQDQRMYLGRWRSDGAADDYIRTMGRAVSNIQNHVFKAVAGGQDFVVPDSGLGFDIGIDPCPGPTTPMEFGAEHLCVEGSDSDSDEVEAPLDPVALPVDDSEDEGQMQAMQYGHGFLMNKNNKTCHRVSPDGLIACRAKGLQRSQWLPELPKEAKLCGRNGCF